MLIFHRNLCLPGGFFRSPQRRVAVDVARHSGRHRHDDSIRHSGARCRVEEAVETLLRTSQSEFPVIDPDGRPIGLLGRTDIIRALKQLGPDARVADTMTSPVPTLGIVNCLDEAFACCMTNPPLRSPSWIHQASS